jgi:hypothetical protein
MDAFLAACPAETVPVFKQLLAMATERAYTIYWGKVGFSIRTLIAGKLTSVLYGWPPAYPPTRIEFYTGYLKLDSDTLAALRAELMSLGVFTLSGDHTYRAVITSATAAPIEAALPALFALVGRIGED